MRRARMSCGNGGVSREAPCLLSFILLFLGIPGSKFLGSRLGREYRAGFFTLVGPDKSSPVECLIVFELLDIFGNVYDM